MGYSESNRTILQIARETTPGVLPGSPVVHAIDYNSIEGFAPKIETVARNPISPSNQRQAGAVVDKMADGKIQMDFTMSLLREFLEGALHAALTGPAPRSPTSCTAAHFVVPTGAVLPENTLVMVRGCAVAANNGLKVVGVGSTATTIVISGGLTAESFTATQGVTVEVCGFRFTAGDAQINASGHLITTTKNLTDFGIPAGQTVWIGGTATANRFAVAANRGPARVSTAPTANLMTFENTTAPFTVDAGTGKNIDLYYGQEARIRYLTDASFLVPTWRTEVTHHQLGAGDVPAYSYCTGMGVRALTITMPDKSKATLDVDMLGLDALAPDTVRTTGYSAAVKLLQKVLVNTTSNILRGRLRRLSDNALRSGYITAVNLKLEAPGERNTAHGVLGSVVNTYGQVAVSAEVNAFFTVPEIMDSLVGNEAIGADWFVVNNDGAVAFDIPEARIGNGQPSYPANKVVTLDLTADANEDSIFGTSMIVSLFPYCPTS